MASYQIIEPEFSARRTESYKLSILLGVDSLIYLVYNNTFQLLLLNRVPFDPAGEDSPETAIRKAIGGDKLLHNNYGSVKIAVDSRLQTLVPHRLFDGSDLRTYFLNLAQLSPGITLAENHLPDLEAHLVYGHSFELLKVLTEFFPSAEVYHLGSAILSGCHKLQQEQSGERIYLNVQDHNLHVAYFRDTELVFYNRFHFRDGKDFVYYALLAYDQFRLDAERIPVSLSGDLTEDSEIYKLLYRYIRHLDFAAAPVTYRLSERAAGQVNEHRYFGLYSLHECRSGLPTIG